jgi:hypothetical protein
MRVNEAIAAKISLRYCNDTVRRTLRPLLFRKGVRACLAR